MSRTVLIYRLGSLGDTVVALPALHLIARRFPTAERWVLTARSSEDRAAPMASVLGGSGLVNGYLEYPRGSRDPRVLLRLRRSIKRLRPELVVYLAAPRGRRNALRDVMFLRSCGIGRIVGVPYTRDLQRPRRGENGFYEFEGARLLRCLSGLGPADSRADGLFDLNLSGEERAMALAAMGNLPEGAPIVAFSIGAKVDVKDWGDANWTALIRRLGVSLAGWSLIAVGAEAERKRSESLLGLWSGPTLNLCGTLPVRASAAALERANLFVGHDSGPMHLAAAVGTTCVAIFSSRNLPGEWFPQGKGHRVIYHRIACQGCRLETCGRHGKECIRSIGVAEVEAAVLDAAACHGRGDVRDD